MNNAIRVRVDEGSLYGNLLYFIKIVVFVKMSMMIYRIIVDRHIDGKDGVSQVRNVSIQQEKVICLECGKALQLLSHRHLAAHGLTPTTYKRKHGMCLTQSLCTYELARRREVLAHNLLANSREAGSS